MKRDNSVLGVLGVLALVALAVLLFASPFVYEGKVRFDTTTEYTAFKEAVAQEHVKIYMIESLSSEPPIIVNFSIAVPRTQVFTYGKRVYTPLVVPAVMIGGVGVLFLAMFFREKVRR